MMQQQPHQQINFYHQHPSSDNSRKENINSQNPYNTYEEQKAMNMQQMYAGPAQKGGLSGANNIAQGNGQ